MYGNVHKAFCDLSRVQYHPEEDVYTCPNGRMLGVKVFDWSRRRWRYQADAADRRGR